MESQNGFVAVTQRIFSNWTALKLIFESDMGSREDIQDFVEYIAGTLSMNDALSSSDLAYELEDYVASKFNTEVDDGSYTEVADELIKFYNYVKTNSETTFQAELDKLSPIQSWLVGPQPRVQKYVEAESTDEVEKTDHPMEVDEWVTVKSKRKSNK